MKLNKKLVVIVVLFSLTITGIAFTKTSERKNRFSNLKVLPKKISSKTLSYIMIGDFEDGLGVGCNYCHAKGSDPNTLDYASDANPKKQIARSMMRMTMAINKKFFKVKHPMLGDTLMIVTCSTCHNGHPKPEKAF